MKIFFALVSAALALSPAVAVPCKDAKTGKFVKCPPAAAKKQVCKDASGKFAKCGAAGAKPI